MADKLTEEELAAIAAFKGEVQIVKRGKSAIPVEGKTWLEGLSGFHRRNNRLRKFERSKERDEMIVEMARQKASIEEMQQATDLDRESVMLRIKRLKIEGYDA